MTTTGKNIVSKSKFGSSILLALGILMIGFFGLIDWKLNRDPQSVLEVVPYYLIAKLNDESTHQELKNFRGEILTSREKRLLNIIEFQSEEELKNAKEYVSFLMNALIFFNIIFGAVLMLTATINLKLIKLIETK